MQVREPTVRAAVAAGMFYPDDPELLRSEVQRLLASASADSSAARAAIVPHAGYAYSGWCAAQVYARIQIPDTVVILGPNHYAAGRQPGEASLWANGAFDTPLGRLLVDEALAADLMGACPHAVHDPEAHALDHALEVQLPFLIVRGAVHRPAIVPILVGWDDWPRCAQLAGAIAEVVLRRGPGKVLLLASSDMTHFEPAAVALHHDEPALEAIRRLDGGWLQHVCREMEISMCGSAAAAVVLEAARQLGATRAEVVSHTHSGMHSGDDSSVVSYAGVVIR